MQKFFFSNWGQVCIILVLLTGCVSGPEPENSAAMESKSRVISSTKSAAGLSENQIMVEAAYAWDNNEVVLELYTEIIRINPMHVLAYFYRADIYQKMNETDKAIADYDKAIELDPNFAYAYLNRGELKLWSKGDNQGIDDLRKAYELTPANLDIALKYVQSVESKDIEQAKALYQDLLAKNKDNLEIYSKYADWLKYTGDVEGSLEILGKALQIAPDNCNLYSERSMIYYQEGRLQEAKKDMDLTLDKCPDDSWYLMLRGEVNLQLRKFTDARKDFTKTMEKEWYDNYVKLYMALLEIEAGKYAAARQWLVELEENDEAIEDISYYKALVQALLGEMAAAKDTLKTFIENYSWDPAGYLGMMIVSFLENNKSEAEDYYKLFDEYAVDNFGTIEQFLKQIKPVLYSLIVLEKKLAPKTDRITALLKTQVR